MADIKQIQVDGNTPLDLNVVDGKIKLAQLNSEVTNLIDEGYSYYGVVDKDHAAITPVGKIFCIATEAGEYTNFEDADGDALVVNEGEVAILKFDGEDWSKALVTRKDDVLYTKLHCVGNGSTLVGVADMQKVPIVAGRKYRFTPLSWDFSNTGTSARVFQIYFFDAEGSYVAEPSILVDRNALPLAESYELTAPDNAVSVGVGGRAANGTDNFVVIEDTTIEAKPISLDAWQANHSYKVGNQIQVGTQYYRCSTAHTSGESFAVSDGWTEITDFINGGENYVQKIGGNPLFQSVIKIDLFGTSMTGHPNGAVMYVTSNHTLRIRDYDGIIKTLPYRPNTLYLYNNEIYVWNGAELVRGVEKSLSESVKSKNNGYISPSTGAGKSSDVYRRTDYLPLENVSKIKITSSYGSSNSAAIAFYDTNKEFISAIANITSANPVDVSLDNSDFPTSAAFVRLSHYIDGYGGYAVEFTYGKTLGDDLLALYSKVNSIKEEDNTSILSLNPDSEWIPKMMSAKKRFYTSSDTTEQPPIVIAHLSDIHGNWINVSRFLEFCEHHSSYINLLLNTGDTVLSQFSDGIAGYEAISGVANIVNVIGNHDTRGESWQEYAGTEVVYNTFFAHISSWGITQPSGAGQGGYFPCYGYKDFSAQMLRVIFLDVMAYDVTEDTWLQGVLADAVTNEYHVVIVAHMAGFMPNDSDAAYEYVSSNWTSLYGRSPITASGTNNYNRYAYHMIESVDAFIADGGIFVGYLCGHSHYDFIAKKGTDNKQWIYTIGSSKAGEVRDYNHIVGTRNQDEFQIVSIDTHLGIVKLFKVGANVDLYGRHKNSICIDYINHTIKAEAF